MELSDAINGRSSVRKMTDYEVTDEELMQIFEAVSLSPSWANNQPWSFIVIKDKELMEKVDGRVPASAMIVACAKKKQSGYLEGEKKTKFKEWFMFDLGIAAYGLCLKAYELGLGTVIMGNLRHDEIKKLLDIPDDHEPIVVIPIGKPAKDSTRPKSRKTVEEIIYLNKFGNRY